MNDFEHIAREVVNSLRSDVLHLIVLPTEKCNFRCTYCYEDFTVGRMKPDTIQGIKRLIERRMPDLRHLTIDWFGGEPLIARDIIEDVCRHVCELARANPKLEFGSGITTNGYLLDLNTVESLGRLNINSYQISLDGPREFHDETRVRAGGSGSFDRIWRNIDGIRRSSLKVRVLLRIHLTPKNLSSMESFLGEIRDRFLGDLRFSVFLKPIERLGGPNNDDIDTISHDDSPEVLRRLRRIVNRDGGCPELDAAAHVCYASKPNSFVIRANGIVGKCTVVLEDPRNHIGRILSNGDMELDNTIIRPWLRGLQTLDSRVLGCPLDDFPVADLRRVIQGKARNNRQPGANSVERSIVQQPERHA
jgi:uncharacterized protein